MTDKICIFCKDKIQDSEQSAITLRPSRFGGFKIVNCHLKCLKNSVLGCIEDEDNIIHKVFSKESIEKMKEVINNERD